MQLLFSCSQKPAKNPMQKLPKKPQKPLAKIFDKNPTKIWWDKNFYIFLNINTNKMKNTNQTKKVVISTRAVYHKYAEVTIEVPSNILDEDVDEWIANNDNFSEELDQKLSEAQFECGFGLDGNMDEADQENETRFDVYDSKGKITWGGHC